MDKIILNGLRFEACHGVLEHEKTEVQPFIIDLELIADLYKASKSDLLSDTVDYASVYALTEKVVMGNTFELIEKLAGEICHQILHGFPKIAEVFIRIKKPNAPLKADFKYMGVELVRRKEDY